jgi:hypothetical protein
MEFQEKLLLRITDLYLFTNFQISEVISQATDNPLLEQNLNKAWYYQCPLCSVKVNTNNDKAKSFDEFIRHIVTGMYYF